MKSSWIRRLACFGLIGLAAHEAQANMSQCRFHFGRPFAGGIPANLVSQLDYVSQWAGSSENYNLSGMLKACKPGGTLAGLTPVVYDYIIAFTLRRDRGLQDCNVGTPSLCQEGAKYLRSATDKAKILSVLAAYARGAANDWGKTDPIIWLMEPDYYQYAQPGSQNGNPLSFAEAAAFMKEMMNTVREHLPNAQFSLDISPWTTDQGQTRNYYTAFDLSRFTYVSTSGGHANASGTAVSTNNKMTYKEIFDLTGKPIIADCGYGVGGASEGHNAAWDDVNNLNNRINDGVVAISQANPNNAEWGNTLANNRSKLGQPKVCPAVSGIAAKTWVSPFSLPILNATDMLGRRKPSQSQVWKDYIPKGFIPL